MLEIETKYNKGDAVTINDKSWIVDSISMRFGRMWVYELKRKNEQGERRHFSIETGSLETIMGDDNGKTGKKTRI